MLRHTTVVKLRHTEAVILRHTTGIEICHASCHSIPVEYRRRQGLRRRPQYVAFNTIVI